MGMTHEIIQLISGYHKARETGLKTALATVVELQGSSYRKPGVRMLLLENGTAYGAVSGGCVEKEIFRQAAGVFQTGQPKIMEYDGRFRLGCEGILYILIEPFEPAETTLEAFEAVVRSRETFRMETYYHTQIGQAPGSGTILLLNGEVHAISGHMPGETGLVLKQEMPPRLRLDIYGGEHDAVQLTALGARLGWEVRVTVASDEAKHPEDFPGVCELRALIPESLDASDVDPQTAVVLMTHSYTKDLKYLMRLAQASPGYLGILGPAARREKLLGDFLERYFGDIPPWIDAVYGPAGLDIGAITPQEIGVSILAEILSVLRQRTIPVSLREKTGAIHS
ncbi:XdhC family protein [Robiginitalea sp. M366]|uniref:XdhC family protein n=1 Tax=Robiginitalea aestuariiviva TaxID=3036903 RepID=UPI00240E4BA0|nr:XdhC/CoxI family protein [Robiginitalea aestuariiviva]MDG1572920.1 XdhC family protein [Robiginitalea aestuariiviva]